MNEIERLRTVLEFKISEYNQELKELETIKEKYETQNNAEEVEKWKRIFDYNEAKKFGLREALDALDIISK